MKRLPVLLLLCLLLTSCAVPAKTTFATVPPVTSAPTAAATRAALVELDYHPELVGTLQSATLTWTTMDDRSVIHTAALTDPDKLRILAGILSGAEPLGFISQCLETQLKHELTVVRADGAVMTVLVSLDSCPTLREGDICYDFENIATQLTGKDSNAAIYELFGASIN